MHLWIRPTCFLLVAAHSFFEVAANSAQTCLTPISALYSAHPACAQSCLGCEGSNESFAHGCDINSTCCQGPDSSYILLVYGCVKTVCSVDDAAKSWNVFLKNCVGKGYPVGVENTPVDYVYVNYAAPTSTSLISVDSSSTVLATSTAISSSTASITQVSATSSTSGIATTPASSSAPAPTSHRLSNQDIIGIAIGVPSALAAIAGAVFKWRQWQLAKRQGDHLDDAKTIAKTKD